MDSFPQIRLGSKLTLKKTDMVLETLISLIYLILMFDSPFSNRIYVPKIGQI